MALGCGRVQFISYLNIFFYIGDFDHSNHNHTDNTQYNYNHCNHNNHSNYNIYIQNNN